MCVNRFAPERSLHKVFRAQRGSIRALVLQACFTAASQRRYTELKGHANVVTKQILLASLSRNVTAELRDQMQR